VNPTDRQITAQAGMGDSTVFMSLSRPTRKRQLPTASITSGEGSNSIRTAALRSKKG